MFTKKFESKIEEFIEENQLAFQKGKDTRDAIGLIRIISERVVDIKEQMCLCFNDWLVSVSTRLNC